MSGRHDVAIAGAGFVGLALAAALARAGLSVALIDPAPDADRRDTRASTIAPASRGLLQAIGAWEGLAPLAEPVLRMEITDGRLEAVVRPLYLAFDAQPAGAMPLAHVVANDDLMTMLRAAAADAGVHTLPARVTALRPVPGGVALDLEGAAPCRAAIVVGADGAGSSIRRLARLQTYGWRYDQAAITTTIAHEHPHDGRAVQHFLEGGPFALLPLPGRRSSIVWAESAAAAARLSRLPDDAFTDELARRAGPVFGSLSLAGPRHTHRLGLQVARRFVGDRVALIGDAAHVVHPLAGQGLNLGFRDVAALAECIVAAARQGDDLGGPAALERYEQWRRFDTLAMLAATEGLGRLFRLDLAPVRLARDIGLGLVDKAPRLKQAITRAAGGLAGEVPRLLRGELP
jgi:2-octaprenyl-6-methoxyphenol hydroxylase